MLQRLSLDFSKHIILIDASYYVFYRYFATLRWFAFQKKEYDVSTITENEEYVKSFINHMKSDINKICKKWKTSASNIIFCADCQRCHIWRNDIFKEYKGNRTQNENFNSNIFSLFNDIIQTMNLKKVSHDRLEADDIVYLLQLDIKTRSNIVIISNDNDYLQLADSNVYIYNMQLKDITLRGQQNSKADLYHKIIFGDKSDNIPKISPTVSKEKSLEISKLSEKEILKWVNSENLKEQFNINLNLVSFEKIPKKIKQSFYNSINITPIS